MFLTVHTAAGLVIGKHLDNSLLAFVLGFISHLVLDMIPHDSIEIEKWPEKESSKLFIIFIFVELPLITILLSTLFLTGHLIFTWPIFWAVIGAIIMDFLWGLYLLLPQIKFLKIFKQINRCLHPPIFSQQVSFMPWHQWLAIQLSFLIVFVLVFLLY